MTATSVTRGARFVFVTDGTSGREVARYAWRLDAANNRPLGRSVGTHSSLEECRASLGDLRRDLPELTDSVSFDAAHGLWTWQISRGRRVCAVSVRTYLRRFECRRALSHFARALVEANPAAGVVRTVRAGALSLFDSVTDHEPVSTEGRDPA